MNKADLDTFIDKNVDGLKAQIMKQPWPWLCGTCGLGLIVGLAVGALF